MTRFEFVTAALEAHGCGPGRNGTWPCPGHDDSTPSLSVTDKGDRVLIHCHAGCAPEAVLAPLGLTLADLHDRGPETNDASEVLRSYLWIHPDGRRFRQERLTDARRKFRWSHPDPTSRDGWRWNGRGDAIPDWLLNPTQVAAAREAGSDIWLCAGCHDAEAANAAGVVATTTADGENVRLRSQHVAQLDGANRVVVMLDNDPAGIKRARLVHEALAGHVGELMFKLPADGYNDVADHIAAGLGLGDLVDFELAPAVEVQSESDGLRRGAEPFDGDLTDLGNARRLVEDHGHDLRYAPQILSWLAWDGTHWAEDVTGEVHRRAKDVVDRLLEEVKNTSGDRREKLLKHWKSSQSAARLRAMVELASTEPGIPVTVDMLDNDPWALNAENGIVGLRAGELREHDRAALHTKLAPVAYDPEAQAPTFRKFLDEVFANDEELIGFVKRFAGYSLTGDVSEHLLVFAHGAGANGKGTLFTALRAAVGDYGMQLAPRILTASKHDEHPTGIADLRGARFVTTTETEQGRYLAESLVKELTGGDPIRARRMRADYFEFNPSHKLWMAGNHLPKVNGTDHGMWRRLALVPFEVTFPIDNGLADRLAAEAAGILAWMVEGCLEWQRDGLQVPAKVRAATESYRSREDHVGRFLADCAVVGETEMVTAAALRDRYLAWCKAEGEREWSAKAVGAELTSRGFDKARTGKSNVSTWIGFGLLPDAPPPPTDDKQDDRRHHATPSLHSPAITPRVGANREKVSHGVAGSLTSANGAEPVHGESVEFDFSSPEFDPDGDVADLTLRDLDRLPDELADDAPPLDDELLEAWFAAEEVG